MGPESSPRRVSFLWCGRYSPEAEGPVWLARGALRNGNEKKAVNFRTGTKVKSTDTGLDWPRYHSESRYLGTGVE